MIDDVQQTLCDIVDRLHSTGIDYMVVGSIAALAHGRSRTTHDFDIVVEADEAALLRFVRGLPPERFYASEEAARDAIRRQSTADHVVRRGDARGQSGGHDRIQARVGQDGRRFRAAEWRQVDLAASDE